MKQQIVLDGRPGAGGAIAAQAVASSPPDGYTLFFATTGTLAINPHLYSKLGYDPFRDFTSVAAASTRFHAFRSFGFDARLTDDLRPLGDLAPEHRGQFLGAHAARLHALRGKAFA